MINPEEDSIKEQFHKIEAGPALLEGHAGRMEVNWRHDKARSLPLPDEKWLLSSALQKSIRQGAVQVAVDVALALHRQHISYLPRRLPIIALEDVGVADVALCFDVLVACGSSRFTGERVADAQERVLTALVVRLALASKSRLACDLLCVAQSHEQADAYLNAFRLWKPVDWADVASDVSDDLVRRLVAIHLLSGITIRAGAAYVTISRPSLPDLLDVAARLRLPLSLRWLVERTRRTEGMAAMLPLAWELCRLGNVGLSSDPLFPGANNAVAGLPAAAFDQHSAVGKDAIALFLRLSTRLQRFVNANAKGSAARRLVGMGIFWCESVRCARRLASPGIDAITRIAEVEEMRMLGLRDRSLTTDLFDLITSEHALLLEARLTIAANRFGPA